MNVWIIGLIVTGLVTLPFLIAALPQKRHRKLKREDVADEIEAFLNGSAGAHDWSDFCTFTIADPELDKIRVRCARLGEEFPPHSGGYCNEEGLAVLRRFVEYLRSTNRLI